MLDELFECKLILAFDVLLELEVSKSSPSFNPLAEAATVEFESTPEVLAFVPALIPDVMDESRVEPEREDRLANVLDCTCDLTRLRLLPCPVSGEDQSDSESEPIE